MSYVDKKFFDAFTQNGTQIYVKIFPKDTYKKFGKIVDVFPQGITIRITRAPNSDYEVGSVYFFPLSSMKLKFVTAEEAL